MTCPWRAGGRLLFLLSYWLAVCRWNGSWGICSGLILGACSWNMREVLEQWRQEEWRWQFSCCQEPGLLRCWACFPVRRRKINTVILRRYDRSVSRTEKNRGFFPSPEREDNIDKPRNACLTERAFP